MRFLYGVMKIFETFCDNWSYNLMNILTPLWSKQLILCYVTFISIKIGGRARIDSTELRSLISHLCSFFFSVVKGNRKCELNCQATGYRFYVRQAEKVIDGTPCDQNGTAICVSGQCKVSATGLGSLWCGYLTRG